jgi:hypothetical protein
LHEFVAHAAAAQVAARVGRAFKFWIEDSRSGRKFIVGHMVVTDDKVNAFFGCVLNFINGLDATVKNNN